MPDPPPPCAAHCWHPTTDYPQPGAKRVIERCCQCPALRVFWWTLAPKAGHGPYADVREWVKLDQPPMPIVVTDPQVAP
jgi:hypothetical protein